MSKCKPTNILNNKPDIKVRGHEKGEFVLLDIATSGDRNVMKKEAESIIKYQDLTAEIRRIWNVIIKVIRGHLEPSHSHSENM